MKNLLLGLAITYGFQYSLSLAYTYQFEKLFDSTCHHSKVGEDLDNRFKCIYKNMPILKPMGDVFLSRPVVSEMHYSTPTFDFRW